jgi:magnesium-protoporphyrin O-methyltransferase
VHAEEDVVKALEKRGFKIKRNDMTATNFYFSRLLEAVRE